MIRRTFAEVKNEIASVAGQSGLTVDDPRLRSMVTLAQDRLCVEGEWPFQYDQIKFCHFGGMVSLPTEYEAIAHAAIGSETVNVMSQWYEFLEHGPGPQDRKGWVNAGIDRGESPVYRQPGGRLRIVSTDGADTGSVVVRGLDVNGVTTVHEFALPFEENTTIQWAKITSVTKPVTAGDVVVSYADEFGEEYQIAVYRPRDTTPTFRRYFFPMLDKCGPEVVVRAIVRRRLFPILEDSDLLMVTNLSALRHGVRAISFEDKGDLANAEASFGIAKGILQQETKLYHPQRANPPVAVSRIEGFSPRADIF